VAGLVATFGAGAMTNSIGEIRDADFLFVTGSNTTEAHPIIAMEMKRAVRRGARLVVADPRSIWLTSIAHRHLKLKPGTDVWLLNALAHVIVAEDLVDRDFLDRNTEGFEAVRETVLRYTPEEAETITGVPADAIRATAREYATTRKAGIYYTLGITEHSHGTDNVYALANLTLMTGHLGLAAAGMNPLRGQNNVQGANDSGATPVFYPGYHRVDDPEVRQRFETGWGVGLSPDPGLNLNQMMKTVGDDIKGIYLLGEDLVVSEPNAAVLEGRMERLEFLIVQDIFMNETARYADVILPGACFAEKDGVFTNSERRVQLVRQAVKPPGRARADWEILVELARACGQEWGFEDTAAIYDEMARLTPKFAGISHAKIERDGGIQWPCPSPEHPGTRFLHEGGVLRGKGLFQAVEYRPPIESEDTEYPLILSTGRTLYHYNAATQTLRTAGLTDKQPQAFIEIHRRDARRRGIADGDIVEVRSRRGHLRCRAMVSRQVRRGCAWMPFHFAAARANLLTVDEGDSVTGTPEYKVCAVEIERVGPPDATVEFPGAYYQESGPGPSGIQ
jgi:formate dehydrogenase major subunit/formate dehydrogenase alpha subunit